MPLSVSEYSTVGGVVLYCVRVIILSRSNSRRHLVNIASVMSVTRR